MLGSSAYARNPLDFYPTPSRCTEAFLEVFGDDLPSMQVWEPFCGNGAISTVIVDHVRDLVSTDIKAYEGDFQPDALFDFFQFGKGGVLSLDDLEAVGKCRPDAIVTNPPYGKLALACIEKALELMEPEKGFVAMLLRKEYDSARKHKHVFREHPAFRAKVDLLFRPRWIADSTGAPRHNYSWYVWDFTKPAGLKPELFYGG